MSDAGEEEVAVLGAGAWGTALAVQAVRAGRRVALWTRDPAAAARIAARRESPRLPGVAIPQAVRVTAELPHAALAVLAVPVAALRATAALTGVPSGPGATCLILCCKGLEPATGLLPLEVVAAVRPGVSAGVLTGPNFAAEIAAGLPAASVIAATDPALRDAAAEAFATPAFRLYGNDDPVGAQIGGAAKNVIAIAAGAVIGAGLGENARAGLITRGIAEVARLVAAAGGRAETAMGLSGLGDLVLTCTGAASRNYSYGLALGRGERLAAAGTPAGVTVEGAAAASALLARYPGVDLPICRAVADLLAGRITLDEAAGRLLARPRRDE